MIKMFYFIYFFLQMFKNKVTFFSSLLSTAAVLCSSLLIAMRIVEKNQANYRAK